MIVCLDSFALLTWLKNEPGAATVDALLNQSSVSDDDRCYVALLNLCEVYYRLLRLKGHGKRTFQAACRDRHTPIG